MKYKYYLRDTASPRKLEKTLIWKDNTIVPNALWREQGRTSAYFSSLLDRNLKFFLRRDISLFVFVPLCDISLFVLFPLYDIFLFFFIPLMRCTVSLQYLFYSRLSLRNIRLWTRRNGERAPLSNPEMSPTPSDRQAYITVHCLQFLLFSSGSTTRSGSKSGTNPAIRTWYVVSSI